MRLGTEYCRLYFVDLNSKVIICHHLTYHVWSSSIPERKSKLFDFLDDSAQHAVSLCAGGLLWFYHKPVGLHKNLATETRDLAIEETLAIGKHPRLVSIESPFFVKKLNSHSCVVFTDHWPDSRQRDRNVTRTSLAASLTGCVSDASATAC